MERQQQNNVAIRFLWKRVIVRYLSKRTARDRDDFVDGRDDLRRESKRAMTTGRRRPHCE